jgi:hypothetical protein
MLERENDTLVFYLKSKHNTYLHFDIVFMEDKIIKMLQTCIGSVMY